MCSFVFQFTLKKCVERLGGMCGAIVTSPFDVVKTRLQSDLFHQKRAGTDVGVLRAGANGATIVMAGTPRAGGLLWHFVETGHIIRYEDLLLSSTVFVT